MADNHDVSMDDDVSEEAIKQQKIINEEYKIWKKNSPFLYDLLYARALEWPTLTTQWFPDVKEVPDSNLKEHRLLLGTNTSGAGSEFLEIAKLQVPDFRPKDPAQFNDVTGEIGGHGSAVKPFTWEIVQKFNHPGEVNKARYMPQNPDIIGSLGVGGAVLIFDRTKHPLQPKDENVNAQIQLTGHTEEGFGMSWSKGNEGHLATASEDKTVRLWDLNGFSSANSSDMAAKRIFRHHSAIVNDVEFHPIHTFFLASVSDDQTLQIIDTRLDDANVAIKKVEAHSDAVNCVAWHPKWEWILATGSADHSVGFWDFRNMKDKIHSTPAAFHDSVIKLEWSPHDTSVLGAASTDRRIIMLDLSMIGEEQSAEEAEDGPPELLFMHGGFTNAVSDFSWNPNDPWLMAAAAEDNQLQCFRPAHNLIYPEAKESSPVAMQDIED